MKCWMCGGTDPGVRVNKRICTWCLQAAFEKAMNEGLVTLVGGGRLDWQGRGPSTITDSNRNAG